MPAPPLSNVFDGGTDGVAITTGNSGGASGDAFSSVTNAPLYSATQVYQGPLSMACPTGGTFTLQRANWTALGSLTGNVYFRWYMWLPVQQTVGNMEILRIETNASVASTGIWQRTSPLGVIRFFNASAASIAATETTNALPVSQWVRCEARVLSSATVGEVEFRLFLSPSSTVPTEITSATGQALGANTDRVFFGVGNQGPTDQTYYYDAVAVSTTDWIGPLAGSTSVASFRARRGVFRPY